MILPTRRKKANKYNARKTVMCGHTFDSKREAEIYLDLLSRKRHGEILRIGFQPSYTLLEAFRDNQGNTQRPITYTADFFVTYADGHSEVVEVKGVRTRDYLLRKKLFLHMMRENVWDVDPVEACAGRPVGLAWFSPDCKHFSKAKGGKPVEKAIRGLAWVAIRWAKLVRPRVIILENVEEFTTWGPLVGNRPDPTRKGQTFRRFVHALKRYGYRVEWNELRACDYGAPTIRKRFFLIARCDGLSIVWPEPTHGDPLTLFVASSMLHPWRTAAEIIDWSIPCPSIFARKKPLCENTMRRIARGLKKFILDNPEPYIVGDGIAPFLIQYHGEQSDKDVRGQAIDRPLMTADASNRYGLVTTFLLKYYGQGEGQTLAEPLHTITTKDKFGIVTACGERYQITDISMRMLTPRELFRAQGFPEDYIIDRDADGKYYPKSAQVARCGNAVPPPFAEALVRANLPELCNAEERESA